MEYLSLSLSFFLIWLIIWFFRKDIRRNLLIVSAVICPLGPISEIWFFQDYWQPSSIGGIPIFFLDAFFSFCLGGVSFGIYKLVFNKSIRKNGSVKKQYHIIIVAISTTLFFLLIGTTLLKVNSILTTSSAFICTGLYIYTLRKDLIIPSLLSSVLVATLFLIIYATLANIFQGTFEKWCIDCNPSGIRLLGVNIEEILWDASWGLVGGVIYEAVTGRIMISKD